MREQSLPHRADFSRLRREPSHTSFPTLSVSSAVDHASPAQNGNGVGGVGTRSRAAVVDGGLVIPAHALHLRHPALLGVSTSRGTPRMGAAVLPCILLCVRITRRVLRWGMYSEQATKGVTSSPWVSHRGEVIPDRHQLSPNSWGAQGKGVTHGLTSQRRAGPVGTKPARYGGTNLRLLHENRHPHNSLDSHRVGGPRHCPLSFFLRRAQRRIPTSNGSCQSELGGRV